MHDELKYGTKFQSPQLGHRYSENVEPPYLRWSPLCFNPRNWGIGIQSQYCGVINDNNNWFQSPQLGHRYSEQPPSRLLNRPPPPFQSPQLGHRYSEVNSCAVPLRIPLSFNPRNWGIGIQSILLALRCLKPGRFNPRNWGIGIQSRAAPSSPPSHGSFNPRNWGIGIQS